MLKDRKVIGYKNFFVNFINSVIDTFGKIIDELGLRMEIVKPL